MKTLWFGLSVLALSGCTMFSQENDSSTSNKPQTSSSGRPSENGEGVPGYLVNPGAITFSLEAGTLVVRGAVGNLQATDSSVLPLYVYRLPPLDATNVKDLGNGAYEITGQLLFSSFANPDGSIFARGVDTSGGPYVLKVGGASTEPLGISSLQTHVTYVYGAGSGTKGEILSVKLLREKYPTVFTSQVPDLTTQASCNAAMRYWNSMTEECTTLKLAKLEHCWNVPDAEKLYDTIKDEISSDAKDELKAFVEAKATLDQCYYNASVPAEINIVFIEKMTDGVKLGVVVVDPNDVKDFILP